MKRPKLDHRHKRFCENIVAGMSQQAAYRAAGFAGGWHGGPEKLTQRPEVKQHIKFLRELQRIRLNVTLQSLVLDLRRAQDIAAASDNAAAFVAATMGLAKLMGFLKEEREADVAIYLNRPLREPTKELELTPDEWVARWAPKPLDKPNGHGNGHGEG